MTNPMKKIALVLAAAVAGTSAPAMAVNIETPAQYVSAAPGEQSVEARRDRRDNRYRNNRHNVSRHDERLNRNSRVWRGRDGNAYCRKSDGTTGLIIGAAGGALLGREIDGGREKTLGTILGGAAGALLGKELDSGTVCR